MKIGAIGIRTKIIVGDAATWHLVKKYIDGKIIDLATDYETLNNKPKINDVELSGNKTSEDLGFVSAVEGKSLVDDLEIEKLAGIEENANNYTHPETHPSSILDVVDMVNGAANKFLNERGEMVAVATSSIGVTGSPLYASTADSDVDGYKSLVGTPQPLETEITLTAKSSDGIVWGAKYLSAPFTEAVTIPATAYGFDYWRKVSAANGTSRKHLRVFLYRAGVETNISTPMVSPDIDETEFTERQISYIFPELALLAGDRIGIQEGFSTTHANNITLTYIVGDGRGWFMRLPLPLKHENLTDKNSEAAVQHIDTTTIKENLVPDDMVAIKDSVTGKMVLTPKSNFDTDNLIAEYTYTGNKEVVVTSLDIATGIFTSQNHGLADNSIIAPATNQNINELPYQVFPNGLNGGQYNHYIVKLIDVDRFAIKKASADTNVATYNSVGDLTKWHFETDLQRGFTIINLKNFKRLKVRLSLKANDGFYFHLIPNRLSETENIWYLSGGVSSIRTLLLSKIGNYMSEIEVNFSFDKISTIQYIISSLSVSSATPNSVTNVSNNLTLTSFKDFSTLTFNSIQLLLSARFILNGTKMRIYKVD